MVPVAKNGHADIFKLFYSSVGLCYLETMEYITYWLHIKLIKIIDYFWQLKTKPCQKLTVNRLCKLRKKIAKNTYLNLFKNATVRVLVFAKMPVQVFVRKAETYLLINKGNLSLNGMTFL